MKIVVIGGRGLIGGKLVELLRRGGHDVLAASRATGVDTLTGAGMAEAFAGAQVVVDVSNSPSFEDRAVLEFFETAGRNIRAAEEAVEVGHHVALSIVGTERLQASGYFRAKLAQEALIKAAGVPYTIVRATQFFEFVGGIADAATQGSTVRVSPAMMQPIAADDVTAILADVTVAAPRCGTLDIAGPEPIRMDDLVRRYLAARSDARQVVVDDAAGYFGSPVDDRSLTPQGEAQLGATRFEEWLGRGG
jgi:uncharacterized protein YbjT (DUF2867 family)